MFGGKKLKDLTEEDIRRYAASLAAGAGATELPDATAEPVSIEPARPVAQPAPTPDGEVPAVIRDSGEVALRAPENDTKKLAQTIAENSAVSPTDADYFDDDERRQASRELLDLGHQELALARDRREQEEEQEARRLARLADEKARQDRLSEEEELRLEVLADLDRSQMPAIHADGGTVIKTIEHYAFADSDDVATIYIELDKDLYEGAAACVKEDMIEAIAKDTEATIWVRGVPASQTVATTVDWRLHLSPLCHSVDSAVVVKLRKGKISVKLKKRKKQPWKKVLKF
eukprot:gnl/TRDRNA2_/TRDRNA2_44813_c0_seq1.p1 gnl/TRDRNA2_/TRDRNA2_44813_c0~~gnl/TRDRNA2_/TRDRNA2_44813_c0_seq1.p1  ORF type:complete len:288 (+),score=73.48 gnl/TRDRNA2_/TRDRNA2_44813_c0_seq1:66-929(+)